MMKKKDLTIPQDSENRPDQNVTTGPTPPSTAPTSFTITTAEPAVLQQLIEQNLGDGGLTISQLDQARVGLGGNTYFRVPSPAGEMQEPELTGVILHSQDVRRFWPLGLEEAGGNTPPSCASDDAVVGVGDPGGDCRRCPHASFRDGPPRCKQQRLLLLQRPTDVLPLVVVAPPSSLAGLSKYFIQLTAQGMPFSGVMTSLTLERVRSGGGIQYSRIVPRLVKPLNAEDVTRVQACARVLRDVLRLPSRSHAA